MGTTGLGGRRGQLHRRLRVLLVRPGTRGEPTGAGSQAGRPAAAFVLSPSPPGGALLPTNPLSEEFLGHPRPLCLPLCPPRLHPGLPTSPVSAWSSGVLWVFPDFSSSACSLRRKGRGERRRRERSRRGREAREAIRRPRELPSWRARAGAAHAEAPPTPPRASPSGRGGAVEATPIPPLLFALSPSRGLLSPSPVAHDPSTLHCGRQAQPLLHLLQLGSSQILCGGAERHGRGLKPRGARARPFTFDPAGVPPSASSCALLLCRARISQASRCSSICEEKEKACPSV